MASQNLYEMFFEWPSTQPSDVIVTGTFDEWSKSKHLNKTARGFVGTVKVPWGEKIKYKFVVDGAWLTLRGQPTETDAGGYTNNVFIVPPPPVAAPAPIAINGIGTVPEAAPLAEVAEPVESPAAVKAEKPAASTIPSAESSSLAPPISSGSRIQIPIVPLNAAEHSTVGSSPPSHPPDFVLPPSRAAAEHLGVTSPVISPIPAEYSTALSSPVEDEIIPPAIEAETEAPSTAVVIEQEEKVVEEEPLVEAPPVAAEATLVELVSEEPAKEETFSSTPLTPPGLKPEEPTPAAEVEEGSETSVTVTEKVEKEQPEQPAASLPTPLPTPPSTPSKKTFPRPGSPSSMASKGSPSSSKFSMRKKRGSLLGKFKHLFHHDKEKEKEKK